MAMYMIFYSVSDTMIDYLESHPENLGYFFEGTKPQPKKSFLDKILGKEDQIIELPYDWPTSEPNSYSPEINHRMVETFHYILNGTKELVGGAGCVFQTWLEPRHSTVAITIDGENFALKSGEISNFKALLESVYPEKATERYLEDLEMDAMPEEDIEFLEQAYTELIKACDFALENTQGLMWCAC